jgi:hypothetical protein
VLGPVELLVGIGGAIILAAGWFNFVCGANYPHQARKGGYFAFAWRVGS